MKIKDLQAGDWFLFQAILHRKLTDTLSSRMDVNGLLEGAPFPHNPEADVQTSEDMTASLIHPRARYREFMNAEDGYTIETNGDWNHPRGVLDARRPETSEEHDPSMTFTASKGHVFMDTPRGSTFHPCLMALPATYLKEPPVAKTPTKPLKLVRSAQKQADIDMALRTHTGGEPDIVLQGRSLNGKGEITISRLFTPAFPEKPALDFKIEGITLDECRALRDYFDSMAADIQETRV